MSSSIKLCQYWYRIPFLMLYYGIGLRCTICSDIEIGDNVLMGPECFFLTFNHAFRDKSRTVKSQGYQPRKNDCRWNGNSSENTSL